MTDGEVAEPKRFREEVALLKEQGIHVVGVGLSTDRGLGEFFDEHYRTVSREPGYYIKS